MVIPLYIGLLDRLLTNIKPLIQSEKTTTQKPCLTHIQFEIDKLKQIELGVVQEIYIQYKDLLEKVEFYFAEPTSEIRQGYVMRRFTEIKSRLLELIALSEESTLKL
jgi:hypothetical protein